MSFFKSRWFPVILAILLSFGTSGYLLMSQWGALFYNLPKVNIEAPPLLWSFKDAEVERLVKELREERKKLDAREADLEKTSAQINVEREELAKVQNDIQASRDQLSAAIVEMQETEAKNLKSLAATYSTMAAPSAVNILAEMDETLVVKIISLMKTDKVAAIFQEMGRRSPDSDMPKRAARLSDKLRLVKANKETPAP